MPITEEEDDEGPNERWGFLMPEPLDGEFKFTGEDTDYLDLWLEETKSGELRLKSTYRKTRAELVSVRPDGSCGSSGRSSPRTAG